MGNRSDRKDEALKQRFAEYQERQREDLLATINNLPRGALGADYEPTSLSDQVTQWRIENGFEAPEDRDGLSVGQKNLLHRAGMAAMRQGSYPEGTRFDAQGQAWQPGAIPGTWVPARPDLPDRHDFEREEKEHRAYEKTAQEIWPIYRTIYSEDHPNDIAAAIGALRHSAGFKMSELNAVASDEQARHAAFEKIHDLSQQIAIEREYGTYQASGYNDDDDCRTDGLLGGGAAGGGVGGGQAPRRSYNEHEAGSLSADLATWQRKQGFTR